ncbi:hypothetical protein DFH09DRAFT_1080163 [Mycena vulgaris]|nr:hypothetical protein DFH09DRAFT_1080163 [Mycena vulgaris]
MCKADMLLLSARNPYIDDRAQVQRTEEDDQYDDDKDSSEAQIRRANEKDFNMRGILADHNARALLTAPYRIPAQFLQLGTETPARGEDWDPDTNIPSPRATSVMPIWLPPPPTGLRAPTPTYEPTERTPLEGRWTRTPLFLLDPESRGPTRFQPRDSRDFTPYVSPRNTIATSSSAHPRPASSSPPPAAKRVHTTSPPCDEAHAQRLYKKLDNGDPEALEAIAARFDKRARDYSVSAACEKHGAVAYVAPNNPALGLVVGTLSTSADVRPAPHNESLRAMERRLKPGLPAENPPVVPMSWILLNGGLAFMLGPKKVLMEHVNLPVPEPQQMDEEEDEYWWKAKPEDTPDRCEERQIAHILYQKKYPAVQPTIDQLVPFRTSCCKALQSRPFAGPSQPLEAGDYALIVDGERRGQTAYVLQIEELSANGHPSPPINILDRVRVNFGPLYRGLSGCIRSFDGSQITIALPLEAPFNEQLPSTLVADGSRTIEVPIENLNRYFLPGDHVVVVRGDRKNLHGLVIKTRDGREVLDDVAMGPGWTVKRHETGGFNLVDSTLRSGLKPTAVVDEPHGAALLPHIDSSEVIEYRGAAQADDMEAYLAQQAGVAAATMKMVQLEPPATFTQLHSILQARDKAAASSTSSLKLGSVEYANIYVQVAFRHRDKGFRGQITTSFDTKERSNHLRVQQTSRHRHRYLEGDTRGIMLTIKNEHNNQVIVPIENVIHDLTHLPLVQARYLPSRVLYAPHLMTPSSAKPRPRTPTPLPQESDPQWGLECSAEEEQQQVAWKREQESLQQRLTFESNQQRLPAELDGTWLGTTGLVGKCVDVVIEGITTFMPPRRIREISAKAIASEGLPGVVLLTEAVSDFGKQLTVFRVGPKQQKIVFPPSYIKPRRDHPQSALITKRVDRVIVLGPDVVSGHTRRHSRKSCIPTAMMWSELDTQMVAAPFFPHPATLPVEERDGQGV